MSRKDFRLIADSLSWQGFQFAMDNDSAASDALSEVVDTLVRVFSEAYPRFDEAKFRHAASWLRIAEENGRNPEPEYSALEDYPELENELA